MQEQHLPGGNSFSALLDLSRRARRALTERELGFVLANDTHTLAAYRQSAMWLASEGIYALSGVVQIEANAPYVHWLSAVCAHVSSLAGPDSYKAAHTLVASDLPSELAQQWDHWWPAYALWLPLPSLGACVLVRDEPWTDSELALLGEWADVWCHAFTYKYRPRLNTRQAWRLWWAGSKSSPWWSQRRYQVALVVLLVLIFPVRLSVLAPGELVPANPVVIRAPLEGVVDVFHVQPNQAVIKDQLLFGFDEVLIQSRVEVAQQALATAMTDYRQTSQMALTDAKSKAQLALLMGKIEEKRAEVNYLTEQLQRSRVRAPQAGVVLMDDPSEWIGKPVIIGERILRIAAEGDVEVEAWIPLADAIVLPAQADVNLYLNASPLLPVQAHLRYMSHDAAQRPEGHQAYRVRAKVIGATTHRVGLKGTVKLHGQWVPLIYWMVRRPWASLRGFVGY